MALFTVGRTRCSLCDETIVDARDVVGLPHVIDDASSPLWPFSDSCMHATCYLGWPLREAFAAAVRVAEQVQARRDAFDAFSRSGTLVPEIPLACVSSSEHQNGLPDRGRHLCGQYDDASIVVYQAYRSEIAQHAIATGTLGGPGFSFERMSWIKPSFLWMMFRSGWGTKPDQEATLALRLRRSFFDELLTASVASSFSGERHGSREAWQAALAGSDVRSQWDPDHDRTGKKLPRRAIQLGLRGERLRRFATTELLEVIDLTAFVAEQRRHVEARGDVQRLPAERIYTPADAAIATHLGLSEASVGFEHRVDWDAIARQIPLD